MNGVTFCRHRHGKEYHGILRPHPISPYELLDSSLTSRPKQMSRVLFLLRVEILAAVSNPIPIDDRVSFVVPVFDSFFVNSVVECKHLSHLVVAVQWCFSFLLLPGFYFSRRFFLKIIVVGNKT